MLIRTGLDGAPKMLGGFADEQFQLQGCTGGNAQPEVRPGLNPHPGVRA